MLRDRIVAFLRRRWLPVRLTAVLVTWAPLVLILGLAVLLRVAQPGVAEFKLDEVEPLALAEQIMTEHRLEAAWGVSSTGLPETPLIGYLLVLPRLVSRDPRAAVIFLGLLDACGVLLTYLAVQRFAGRRAALLAAALYAVNPWAVLFSRKTWAEIIPLLTVLIFWASAEVVIRARPKWALFFFPLLALQVQAHVMGILFLPPLLLTLVLAPRRWKSRYTFVGLVAGVLILAPYAWVLLHRAPVDFSSPGMGQRLVFDRRALDYVLRFASGATLTALLGESAGALAAWERALGVLHLLVVAALALGVGVAVVGLREPRQRPWYALLLIWLLSPLVPLTFLRGAQGIHYLVLLVPVLFITAALGWQRLLTVRNRFLSGLAFTVLGVVLATQAGAVGAIYRAVPRYSTAGGFGLPLQFWLQIQRGVQRHAEREGWHELQVLGGDGAPWSNERRALDHLLGRQIGLRWVGQGNRQGILVSETGVSAALVLSPDEGLAQALRRWGQPIESWPHPGEKQAIALYRLQSPTRADLGAHLALPGRVAFANGMSLLGLDVPPRVMPGDTVAVIAYWAYDRPEPPTDDADVAFYHLLDAGDKRWAQSDGFAAPQAVWRAGETIVEWFALSLPPDIPPGDYVLAIGMYSWRDMHRANVVGADGQPIAGDARLGPLHVVAP